MKNLTWCQVVIRTQSIVSSRIEVIVENAISSNVYLDIGSPSETQVKVCKSCIFSIIHFTSYLYSKVTMNDASEESSLTVEQGRGQKTYKDKSNK